MSKNRFTLAFSPCPNDTFIFDALVNKKIETGNFEFEVILEDVETLNQWALEGRIDISKISYGLWPAVQEEYVLLNSGGALGKGTGPLLIAKYQIQDSLPDFREKIQELEVAIPGEHTTAHLLFSMAFPLATRKKFMLFSEIESAVLDGEVDCGLIIHESRFTYAQKGLKKIMDLGDYWEKETGVPVPLGGIVMKKKFNLKTIQTVDQLVRDSLAYAVANYPDLPEYVRKHSQEMDEGVMRKHIDLYVNDYSMDLGEEGRNALKKLIQVYEHARRRSAIGE
jgi:1,4-dihydroxy-6-naphthoate synthase